MHILPFNFQTQDWETIAKQEHKGESGIAIWQTVFAGDTRIRMVQYSSGYRADHWCKKGHIIYCMEGEMETALQDGRIMKLCKGMTYIVGDNCEAHRSSTVTGCKLFIVD